MAINTIYDSPENGWVRFEETTSGIEFSGEWRESLNAGYSGGSRKISPKTSKSDTISFKFFGDKIRLLSSMHSEYSKSIGVVIDGVEFVASQALRVTANKVCFFEKTDLAEGEHEVLIYKKTSGTYTNDLTFDAIDLNEGGYIIGLLGKRYLFIKNNIAYTMVEGEIKSLDAITIANAATLFKNGMSTITKEDCYLVGQSLNKAKIACMDI